MDILAMELQLHAAGIDDLNVSVDACDMLGL